MAGTCSRAHVKGERTKLRRLERELERAGGAVAGLEKFLRELAPALDPGAFIRLLLMTLAGRLGICRLALYGRGERRQGFDLLHSLGLPQGLIPQGLQAGSALERRLRQGVFPAPLEEFFGAAQAAGASRDASLEALGGSGMRYACATEDPAGMRGLILLGPKVDGSGLTLTDVELLRMMTRILAAVMRTASARAPRTLSWNESRAVADLKMDFVGRTARGIGTPLAVLKSSLWSLETAAAGDAVLIDMAKDAVLRLQDQIEQIVALSDIGDGEGSIDLRRTELVQLIEDVCRQMIPEFEERNITVGIDDASARREVLLDRPMIGIALRGILGEALASAGRGGRIEIDLCLDEDGSWLVMRTCWRRGSAPPAGAEPQEPPRESKPAGDPAVLRPDPGLSVSRLVVAGHGGRLEHCGEEDGATGLTLRLPL